VYQGFSFDLIPLLRCPRDAGVLRLAGTGQQEGHILRGTLGCVECRTEYPITEGIAQLFDPSTIDGVSKHEHQRRDQGAAKDNFGWETSAQSQMEIIPTMESLQSLGGMSVLELGCGKGRFTTIMARQSATIIAMDFSMEVLKRLSSRVEPLWRIGLVQADCTKPVVASQSFQRALSTLVSNLPTRQHRHAMYRVVADALTTDGRFVFNAHHHALRQRFRNIPQAGHYPESGIFRYLFRRSEVMEECGLYFERVQCRPIQITLPLAGRLGLQTVTLSRIAEKVPVLNQLGELLLGVGERSIEPRRERGSCPRI